MAPLSMGLGDALSPLQTVSINCLIGSEHALVEVDSTLHLTIFCLLV